MFVIFSVFVLVLMLMKYLWDFTCSLYAFPCDSEICLVTTLQLKKKKKTKTKKQKAQQNNLQHAAVL